MGEEFADLKTWYSKRAQLTVTVPQTLARHVEELAKEHGLTKSAVVASILEHDMTKRHEALMREGYEEMGRVNFPDSPDDSGEGK